MKTFRKIVGLILMAFNGIGVVSIIGTADKFIRDGMFGMLIAMLLVFGALAFLGYKIYPSDRRNGHPKPAAAAEAPDPAQDRADQDPAPAGTVEQRAVPDSAESVVISTACTVIANYLALPFHDGDRFFLFGKEADAVRFIQKSGRNDLSVRRLDNDIIKRELTEYLCCGYTGAVIKNNPASIGICQQDQLLSTEDLIREFDLAGLSTVGNIVPPAEKKMHLYLNQMSYTYRKYGADMSAVPDSWRTHLKTFKDDVIRYLLCANLCLPRQQGDGDRMTISVLTVSMPSGQKWAAVFTDMFAIFRYTRKRPDSIVFPNLLSDVAKDIRTGRIRGVAGIMINPGREEFKMTVDEIAEQEQWLEGNPEMRRLFFEKVRLPADAKPEAADKSSPAAHAGAAVSHPAEAPEPAGEAWRKIDLTKDREPAPVTPGRGFFTGLLPDEKPFSEQDPVCAEPGTEGYTKLDVIGFPSRQSEYWYDPKYRRIVIDVYSAGSGTGGRRYHGRKTILPLDLIDQFNQYPEDRNPEKTARIQRIQKIIGQEDFGE